MKVILAKHAGFCMGVRRAVETTLDMIRKESNNIATFGPLIHNPQVLDMLAEKGVKVLDGIPAHMQGTVIIRAHGVPPEQKQQLVLSGAKVEDATCPRVMKVQAIIRKYASQGYATIIIGDKNHAEVKGLEGYAGPMGHVLSNEEDVAQLSLDAPYIIVSQTTQDEKMFDRLQDLILARFPNGKVFNTICDSTHKRQEELRQLCGQVEAVVVVGGKESANTQRLGEIVKNMGKPVFMAETEEDLDLHEIGVYSCVGVAAGASTPTWVINRVVQALESLPGKGGGAAGVFFYKLVWLLLATNLYTAFGGAALSYAACRLLGIDFNVLYAGIVFGYLFGMHNINRFSALKAKQFNDPTRASFCGRYWRQLLGASVASLGGAATAAYAVGLKAFLVLSVITLFGLLYNVRVVPDILLSLFRVRGLKEIPGSKTFFVASAWAFVIVLVPVVDTLVVSGRMTSATFILVSLFVYLRTAMFDLFDVQGDRIVGRETLPVFLGEKKTIRLMYLVVGVLLSFLSLFPSVRLVTSASYWLLPGAVYSGWLLYIYEQGKIKPGLRFEFAVESVFPLLTVFVWAGTIVQR